MPDLLARRSPHHEEVPSPAPSPDPPVRAILAGLEGVAAQTGVGAATTALRLKALTAQITEAHEGMTQVTEAAEQIQQGVQLVAQSAGEAAQIGSQVEELASQSQQLGEQATTANRTLQEQVHQMAGMISALMERVREITRVSQVIDQIAAQTKLLALNATIEAARAGQQGRGFAVVASEVGKLAERSVAQTREIGALVRAVSQELQPAQAALQRSQALVDLASARTDEAGQALTQIRVLAHRSARHIEQVAAAVEEQTALMESLYASTRQVTTGVDGIRGEAGQIAQATQLLSRQTEEAYQYLGRYPIDTSFHRVLGLMRALAQDAQGVFERAIDEGRLSLSDVLSLAYREIKGPAIQSLQRLFDVSRVPPTGFDPPKFSTAYDAVVDRPLMALIDATMAKEPRIDTATIIDLNGYIPIHPSKFCADWTGDPARDLVGNRCKKIYLGASLRGARVGLPAANLPERVKTREEFVRAGCELRESPARRLEFLVQTYGRDTGEVVILLTVPVFVKGERFGAATATWRPER